jgi:hypothetical protein
LTGKVLRDSSHQAKLASLILTPRVTPISERQPKESSDVCRNPAFRRHRRTRIFRPDHCDLGKRRRRRLLDEMSVLSKGVLCDLQKRIIWKMFRLQHISL